MKRAVERKKVVEGKRDVLREREEAVGREMESEEKGR